MAHTMQTICKQLMAIVQQDAGLTYLRPAKVDSSKAIPVRSPTSDIFFLSIGMNYHCNWLVGIEVGFIIQARRTEKGFLGSFYFPFPDQPHGDSGAK
jgi:hypothetical protein